MPPAARLKAADAFADDSAACAGANYPVMGENPFYNWLVAKADPDASVKSSGRIFYKGWRLVTPGEAEQPAEAPPPEQPASKSDPSLMTVPLGDGANWQPGAQSNGFLLVLGGSRCCI